MNICGNNTRVILCLSLSGAARGRPDGVELWLPEFSSKGLSPQELLSARPPKVHEAAEPWVLSQRLGRQISVSGQDSGTG